MFSIIFSIISGLDAATTTFPFTKCACGLPVITYDTGGSSEAVDKETGIVIAQGDITALAKAIRTIKEHHFSRTACRARAVEKFDKNKNFMKYIDLYEELLFNK